MSGPRPLFRDDDRPRQIRARSCGVHVATVTRCNSRRSRSPAGSVGTRSPHAIASPEDSCRHDAFYRATPRFRSPGIGNRESGIGTGNWDSTRSHGSRFPVPSSPESAVPSDPVPGPQSLISHLLRRLQHVADVPRQGPRFLRRRGSVVNRRLHPRGAQRNEIDPDVLQHQRRALELRDE